MRKRLRDIDRSFVSWADDSQTPGIFGRQLPVSLVSHLRSVCRYFVIRDSASGVLQRSPLASGQGESQTAPLDFRPPVFRTAPKLIIKVGDRANR
jgi:hypothetical protein